MNVVMGIELRATASWARDLPLCYTPCLSLGGSGKGSSTELHLQFSVPYLGKRDCEAAQETLYLQMISFPRPLPLK